jgi:hypothetical protein
MVIPKEFRNYILKELHNSPTGHLGVKKTIQSQVEIFLVWVINRCR